MPLPTFATGEPMTAVAANTLARQGIITVPTLLERDNLAGPHAGMVCYVEDTQTYYHHGTGGWRVLYAAPRPYTPTLTNMTLGNGTLQAEWSQNGDIVHWWARIVLGSTSSVAGLIYVRLPKPPARGVVAATGGVLVGGVLCRDVSASGPGSRRTYDLISDYTASPQDAWSVSQLDGDGARTTNPWTWATGDSLDFSGSYRVAD